MSCVCEEVTRREIHEELTRRGTCYFGSVEESDHKDANMAMDVPFEEDCEHEWAEAWVDIDGQELDPQNVEESKSTGDEMVQENERTRRDSQRALQDT